MKILILALSGIGDALMFTPALTLLRKEIPSAEIDALVMIKGVREIYERNKNINNVIYFDFIKEGVLSSLKFISSLRKKYDLSINVYPSNRKEYNIINYLIGARERGGINYLKRDKQNFGFLNNIRVNENEASHNVQTNIKLIEKIFSKTFIEKPRLEFPLSESDLSFAKDYLNQLNISENDFIVGFHPGCATLKNHIKRRWEPEKFARLAEQLIERDNAKVLIFGGSEEDELKENIAAQVNSRNVHVLKTSSLTSSAAVMKRCNIFVTNDSSLMHIVSALGLKVLTILGPTNRFFIHPWETDYSIVSLNLSCSPCFFYSPKPLKCYRDDVQFKCIKEIDVSMVYKAMNELTKVNEQKNI